MGKAADYFAKMGRRTSRSRRRRVHRRTRLRTAPEAILAADPDVLIAAWCGAGDRVPLEKIVHDRGWRQMRAVRESRVYCIRDELMNTPAPTLVEGLRALAAAIHPELFHNLTG